MQKILRRFIHYESTTELNLDKKRNHSSDATDLSTKPNLDIMYFKKA